MIEIFTHQIRRITLLTAIACSNAVAVASLYLPQVVLPVVFPADRDKPGWLPITAVFLGYCIGNANTAFDIVPFIAKSTRNQFALLSAALLITGAAPTMPVFTVACFFTGIGASAAQRLLGVAAHLAGSRRDGNAVAGCIAAALLLVLGVRVWGEQLATAFGWRTLFVLMSIPFVGCLIFGQSIIGSGASTSAPPTPAQGAPMLVVQLIKSSSLLRRSMAQQAMVFASYNAAWVLLAAQIVPGERVIASFWGPLTGIACLLMGAVLIDHGRISWLNRLGNAAMFIPGCPLLLLAYAGSAAVGNRQGLGYVAALPFGMALIDAGMQLTLVSNQVRVQAIAPASRGRLASLLTISGSLGGAIGGGLSHFLWQHSGWKTALALVTASAAGGLIAACAKLRVPAFFSEALQEPRVMRLVGLSLRIWTTASAARCAAHRDRRGKFVNQRSH